MMHAGPDDHCTALLRYAAGQITEEDIARFAPADPGYPCYVTALAALLKSNTPPRKASFELRESIALTGWMDPDEFDDPPRFRRFRLFTGTAGLSLLASGLAVDCLPPNYIVVDLLDDARALGDSQLLGLLSPAFEQVHAALASRDELDEAPFLLLGQMVLAFAGHHPATDLRRLARHLIDEESRMCPRQGGDFLWGGTCFAQKRAQWMRLLQAVLPPTHADADVCLVCSALAAT